MDRVIGHEYYFFKISTLEGLGGSYIVLPKYIKDKKTCINVKNKDDNCFRWALSSARFPVDNHTDRT